MRILTTAWLTPTMSALLLSVNYACPYVVASDSTSNQVGTPHGRPVNESPSSKRTSKTRPYQGIDVRSFYEHIHKTPELGKAEFKTAEFLRSKLKDFGYSEFVDEPTLPTAVIAVLNTGKEGPTICFRAEMDARKCQEETGLSFASTTPGIMHNCGHDAHAAILLETAHKLMMESSSLRGKFVFLFQPAEESAGGADDIVNDGVLKKLGVQAIFAQHCASGVEVGKHTLHGGAIMAGSNTFSVKLSGTGGHAAQPHERDDLAGLSSLITLELERIPARCFDVVQYPTVCNVSTSKWSSEQVNVAPDTITLGGTVRAFYGIDDKLFRGKSFRELFEQLVNGLSNAYGVKPEISLKPGSPVTVNDPKLCDRVLKLLSSDKISVEDAERSMFAEDFAFYTAQIPSAYFGLGIARGAVGKDNVHSAHFNIDEDCLDSGVDLFMSIAENSSRLGL